MKKLLMLILTGMKGQVPSPSEQVTFYHNGGGSYRDIG